MWQKEEVIHKLQGSGRRVTRQREMLLEMILDGSWSSCKEIYYEAAKRDPSIGLATVYRMVGTLEDIGVLTRSYHYCLPAKERQDECASA